MMTFYDFWQNVWAVAFPGYFVTENSDMFKFFSMICTLATCYVCLKYLVKLCRWIVGGRKWKE